jgi:hypothetical protein
LCEPESPAELEDVHISGRDAPDVNSSFYVPDPVFVQFVTSAAPDNKGLKALIAQKFGQDANSIHVAYKFDIR